VALFHHAATLPLSEGSMAPFDHPCDVSPFCRPVSTVLTRSGLPLDLPWRWVHLGPIEPRIVPVIEHRCRRQFSTSRLDQANGLGRFSGYHLDLLGLAARPPDVAARWYPGARLWAVYAVAHRVAEGVGVEWRAESSGIGTFAPIGLGADPIPDTGAIIGRCFDLLLGRALGAERPKAGGRRRDPEMKAHHDAIAAEAEALKAAGGNYGVIARNFNIDERTLRTYRHEWHASSTELRRSS